MTPLVAGWASSPARRIPLRPFRSDRLACRPERIVPVWPAPSLVVFAKGVVRALAALWVSILDDCIHLALFHSLVQGIEHPFGTQALGYWPAHDSATEHVEDAGQIHEARKGRHVDPALGGRSGGDVRRHLQLVPDVRIDPLLLATTWAADRSFSPVMRGATPPGTAHFGHSCLVPSPQPAVWGAHQMFSVQLIRPDTSASVGAVPGWASVSPATAEGASKWSYIENPS